MEKPPPLLKALINNETTKPSIPARAMPLLYTNSQHKTNNKTQEYRNNHHRHSIDLKKPDRRQIWYVVPHADACREAPATTI